MGIKICLDPSQATDPVDEDYWCSRCKNEYLSRPEHERKVIPKPYMVNAEIKFITLTGISTLYFQQCISCSAYELGSLHNEHFESHQIYEWFDYLKKYPFNNKIEP